MSDLARNAGARERAAGEPRPPSAQPYLPLVVLAAAGMAGIVCDHRWPAPLEVWWMVATVSLLAWLVAWRKGALKAAACLMLISLAAIGAARHHLHWSIFLEDDLGRLARETPQPVCVEAVALEHPRWRPAPAPSPLASFERGDQTILDVRLVRRRDGRTWRPASGKAGLVVAGHLLDVRAGDRLRILGLLQRPSPSLNPGDFDFARHERAERKLCRISVDHPDAVAILARGSPWRLNRWIGAVRKRGDELLWRHVGQDRASLASALILGLREQLDRQRIEPFFLTGTMHVLAISGLNVGILAAGFWLVAPLGIVPRRIALLAAIVLVALYAILTDAEPPVVRAAVLVVVVCLGKLFGQPVLAFNTLAAAALIVLAINPTELFDTGAQLSFLAVAALGIAAQRVAPWSRLPDDPLDRLIAQTRSWPKRLLRSIGWRSAQLLAVSAAVWLAVLPLTMYRFHIVSPQAILLNLFIELPLAAALYAGLGVLLFGPWLPPLAAVCGGACDRSLAVLEWMTAVAQDWLHVHFWTPGPATWWVLGCYAGLAAWVFFPRRRPPKRWLAPLAAGWMALGLSPPDNGFPAITSGENESQPVQAGFLDSTRFTPDEPQLACTFIAVGHGVSVLVEFPNGRTLLYDAGGMGPPSLVARGIAGVLWSRGLRRVDAVVLSHADADHYNALPELLKQFGVGAAYVSPVMFDEPTPALDALREAIRQAGVPLREISLGDRLAADSDVLVEVVHPPRRGALGSDNANSIVLHIEAFGRRVLLTGDLEGAALEDLLQEEPVAYDAALAPHHGSNHSNPPGFAAWAKPQATIISGAQRDVNFQVQSAYRAAGSHVYHTAQNGAVRVTLRAEGMYVQTWRRQRKT
jgi:competence protein ComEC